MLKPSETVIRALSNLAGNTNFDVITDWIRESLFAQSVANNTTSGELTIKNQGRNLELKELMDHINKVPEYVKNLKTK